MLSSPGNYTIKQRMLVSSQRNFKPQRTLKTEFKVQRFVSDFSVFCGFTLNFN